MAAFGKGEQNGHEEAQEQARLTALTVQSDEDPDADNELVRYAKVILGRKWLVLFCVLVFMLAAALQLRKATPLYVATAMIKYEPNAIRVVDFGEIGRPVSSFDEIKTQIELIKSPAITQAVIDALGQNQTTPATPITTETTPIDKALALIDMLKWKLRGVLVPFQPVELPQDQMLEQGRIRALQNRVVVAQKLETKLITITVRDSDPISAARIANEFATQYEHYLKANKTNSYDYAKKFFDEQISAAKDALSKSEQALLEYAGREDLKVLVQEESITLEIIASIRKQIEGLKDTIAFAEAQAANKDDQSVKMALLSQDPQYRRLEEAITEKNLSRVTLDSSNQPNHPDVIKLGVEIKALEDERKKLIGDFDVKASGQYSLSKQNLVALETRRNELETRLGEIQRKMVDYRVLQREAEAQKQFYDSLLSRLNQISAAGEVGASNVSIISYADFPSAPSEPRVARSLMVHGIIGMILGCSIALGLFWLDRSMRDPRQVQMLTGLPTLGILPYMGGTLKSFFGSRRRGGVKLIRDFDPYSVEAESFRLLRTSLQYSTAGHSPQVVMVTSCSPGEGKSTASSNLAIAFAGLGEKTLLLDADLKLPNLHRIFNVARKPGLSDVLTGQLKTKDVIVTSGIDNLDLIPAGPQSPNPVELLESKVMADVINELRKTYKHIVIDTAPLHGMSDSYVLANKTDGVCLLTSLGRTRLDLFRRTVASLGAMKIRVLGVIYNNQAGDRPIGGEYTGYAKPGGYGYMKKGRGRYDRKAHDSDEIKLPPKQAKEDDLAEKK